jgi:TM2 domain-containing membrane protein YozV
MDCVNHSGTNATAYCQTCGKPLCANCVRNMPGGQIFCDQCLASWQAYQQPFVAPPPGEPNPITAAVLGIIPGVGAMYNGQFIKGLIHVVIFAVLITITDHFGIFGLFIAAWIVYQSFEAYYTAKARRDGLPLPDPLGLNEVGNWLSPGGRAQQPGQPGVAPGQSNPGPAAPDSYQAPFAGPYQAPYQAPFAPPAAGYPDPGMPPVPPPPSQCWRHKEPVGAIVLIALGVLFLLNQLNVFNGRIFDFAWPVLLIGLGIWLIIRRLGESQGGSK